MTNIAVCGANGKMGQEVIKAVNNAKDLTLVAKIIALVKQVVVFRTIPASIISLVLRTLIILDILKSPKSIRPIHILL